VESVSRDDISGTIKKKACAAARGATVEGVIRDVVIKIISRCASQYQLRVIAHLNEVEEYTSINAAIVSPHLIDNVVVKNPPLLERLN
jgi:hypothetical protein